MAQITFRSRDGSRGYRARRRGFYRKGRVVNVEVRNESGYWSVFVNGQRTVDRESFAVADRVKFYLDNPKRWDYSECCDVADSIRRHLQPTADIQS